MKNKKIIFDLCGTIVDSNTTFDFIKYYHRKKRNYMAYIYVSLLTSIFGKILHRTFRFSMRKKALKTLKGILPEQLISLAYGFSEVTLKNKKIDIVFKILEFYKNNENYEIIIASASINPVVQAFSIILNIPFISSELEIKDKRITGYISCDLKGNKLKYFSEEQIHLVITDNFDDLPLIQKAEKAIIISKSKNIDKWKNIGLNKNKEYLIEL
ncbi:haloacid dehalogenase-like hydrolase [Providencia rettgeri]|uniref:haloacid dehalogenase-like hydrolase n=1 Tax=Providencia TaxID=586 RepID=UPI00234A69BD|nr:MULTISPECIES: haloacid dehalogenase-like hydrolase [Providencia]MDH2397121.1 haloacid dehalogenase-like hydrolase [Providencia rettgeri]